MSGKKLWEFRVGVFATEIEARELEERIARLLCPDPNHASPCPVPWSMSLCPEEYLEPDEQDMYRDLEEQYRIESPGRDETP
ncbi:hypothetical protein [Nocardia paucivorans]|uniref:hypothetical protein n=1 Tax=Nocardia paucivorans TaxID=114259 RepID=UPI0002DC1E9F|nr:hypothetical protein [Nocardia paucivorans]